MDRKNKIILLILILIATTFYFIATFERVAVPGAIFNLLETDLKVSAPFITAFGAVFMYVYALNQLVMGVMVDRFGGFRIMFAGGVILGLGSILFPVTSNLFLMYLSRALLGLGGSMFYLSTIKELKNLFSDKDFGIAISVMLFIGYCGGVFANAPFVFALQYVSWREALIAIACTVFIALILFSLLITQVKLAPVNKSVKMRTLPFKLVLHKRHNRNLFSFACCNFGIFYVIQAIIGKKFLEDFCLMSPGDAALVLSGMAVIAAVFNIVNAYVCKLFHNHRVRFLKNASVITFGSLLVICICLFCEIRTYFVAVLFCVLAANASLTSLLVPVLHLTNRKFVSSTAVGIMNFCFFTMVGILGTLSGFLLNIFPPEKYDGVSVYSPHSYLLLFGLFLMLSIFEMYKAMKLSENF